MNKEIVLQERVSYIATGFELVYSTDKPSEKILSVKVNLVSEDGEKFDYPEFVLVSGDDYDSFGQWTDTDLQNKISETFN